MTFDRLREISEQWQNDEHDCQNCEYCNNKRALDAYLAHNPEAQDGTAEVPKSVLKYYNLA